ncbi:hypothetical protein EW026_g6666 [Hermanssonia centrifuga]|uniref:DUF6533 domain-containing protein n=1 Tax=Hermanssonia centrifuga TaxID=98765 RepID=A0A4S4KA96_9APHY|nr:hypothetical protein EW026_g6666 [Hermanssonia centrifuga]
MSETSPDSAEIIAEFYDDLVEQFMISAMCTAYEYIITLNQEVTMIWRRKWSMVTWIFMANRYLMMSSVIWNSTPATAEYSSTQEAYVYTATPGQGTYCGYNLNMSPSLNLHALLLMSLALVLVNVVPSLENISPIENILTTLEPILISRFLLNLRQVGVEVDPVNNTQDASASRFSVPRFRVTPLESILMVGNMGEDLDHGPAELEGTEITDVDEGADPLDPSTEVPSGELI